MTFTSAIVINFVSIWTAYTILYSTKFQHCTNNKTICLSHHYTYITSLRHNHNFNTRMFFLALYAITSNCTMTEHKCCMLKLFSVYSKGPFSQVYKLCLGEGIITNVCFSYSIKFK